MHSAALAVAVGVLVGMYIRCAAFDFRATWQGAWISAGALENLVKTIFWPAAILLGVELPEIGAVSPSHEQAHLWFRLQAWTALIFLILPRLSMLVYTALRCHKLAADLPIDLEEGYFRRMWTG